MPAHTKKTPPVHPLAKLEEPQLKAKLKQCAKFVKLAKEKMAPYLYFLRQRIRKQGSRTGEGFGAWVEKNLSITRRTADLWADDWARKHKLKPERSPLEKLPKVALGVSSDGVLQVRFALSPERTREFNEAYEEIGHERATDIMFDAITRAYADKKLSGSSTDTSSRAAAA
jgi:hypothetical protein